MVAMIDFLLDRGQLARQSLMQSKTKHLREPIGGEAEQSQIAGTLVELVYGKVATEDKVATVLDLLQGVVAAEIHGLAIMQRKLRAYHPGPVIQLLGAPLPYAWARSCPFP